MEHRCGQQTDDASSDGDYTSDEWGFECTLIGGRVECRTPEGFSAAAADDQAIQYLQRIAAELARLPHRYAYDPQTAYTVLVQTWDRARLSARSLAFGRKTAGQGQVGLIPDAYYIHSDGYAGLYVASLRMPAWADREACIAWRGSVTGQGRFASPLDIPRVRLAFASRVLCDTDVKLMDVHETLRFPHDELRRFLAEHDLSGERWPMQSFSRYKFCIDIDGHANAWGLLEKLILGCCVLKVASPFEQWYYPRLHAWEHYVPVAADLSDLAERVQWCRDNDAHCRWIAENGVRLAATLRHHLELPRSCLQFMQTANAAFPPRSPG